MVKSNWVKWLAYSFLLSELIVTLTLIFLPILI